MSHPASPDIYPVLSADELTLIYDLATSRDRGAWLSKLDDQEAAAAHKLAALGLLSQHRGSEGGRAGLYFSVPVAGMEAFNRHQKKLIADGARSAAPQRRKSAAA